MPPAEALGSAAIVQVLHQGLKLVQLMTGAQTRIAIKSSPGACGGNNFFRP